MAIGDQDHRCIAMTTSAHLAGSVHELLDLALGEIAAFDCEAFSVWCAAIGCLSCHGKSLSCKDHWKDNSFFLHSLGIRYLSFVPVSFEAIEKNRKRENCEKSDFGFFFF